MPIDVSTPTPPSAGTHLASRDGRALRRLWAVRLKVYLPPLIAVFVSLVIVASAALGTLHSSQTQRQLTFDAYSDDLRETLGRRLAVLGMVLDGGAGILVDSDANARDEWRRFVLGVSRDTSLAAIRGLGVVDATGAALRDDRPDAPLKVMLYQPLPDRKLDAMPDLGLDTAGRQAAVDAGLSGRPVLLKRTNAPGQAELLLIRPIYITGQIPGSTNERRMAFHGWIFAPLSESGLFAGLGREADLIRVQVYDGESPTAENLLYDSASRIGEAQGDFTGSGTLEAFSRNWIVRTVSTPKFDAMQDLRPALLVLAIGTLLAFALGWIILQTTRRERTVRIEVDRKNRELNEKAAQARSIFDNATVPIMILDDKLKVLQANGAVQEIFGFTPAELAEATVDRIIPQLSRSDLGEVRHVEGRSRHGRQLQLDVSLNAWAASDGSKRYTLVVHDLTEEYHSAFRVREAERRWDKALVGANIGVFDLDLRDDTSVVSDTWRKIMNVPENDPLEDAQDFFRTHVHPTDYKIVRASNLACINGETERSVVEYRVQVAPNVWRWMRSDAVVVERDPTGKAVRMVGAQTDVTHIRSSEEALRRSQEQFRMVIDNAPVGMALIDGDGGLVNVNTALCELLGYNTDNIWEQDFSTILAPDENFLLRQSINWLSQEKKDTYSGEHNFLRADGSLLCCLLSISWTLNEKNEVEFYIAQLQDISERKMLERAKSEFIATVSHELRTPLTSIKGALGLVFGSMEADIPPKMRRMFDIALSNTNRLVELVNDILDTEKITSGKLTLTIDQAPASDLVRRAVEDLRTYASQYDVEIVPHFADNLPMVSVDTARFLQVMNNLMSNAVKFSRKGGKVIVMAEILPAAVRVSIEDSGMGIPDAFRARIFQPFSQADGSDRRAKGGTGLGLSITKQLVELMKGQIGFESQENVGTTFWFTVPLVDAVARTRMLDRPAAQVG